MSNKKVRSGDQRSPLGSQPVEHGKPPTNREGDKAGCNKTVTDPDVVTGKLVDLDAYTVSNRPVIETVEHGTLGAGDGLGHAGRLTPNGPPDKGSAVLGDQGKVQS